MCGRQEVRQRARVGDGIGPFRPIPDVLAVDFSYEAANEDPLLRAVEGRIGALTGIPAHAGENLLLQARARGHPGVVTSSTPS